MEKRKKRRYQGSVKVPSTSIRMGKVNYTAYMTHHSGKLIFLAANTKHNPKFACTCILPGFLRCVVGAGSLQYQYKAICATSTDNKLSSLRHRLPDLGIETGSQKHLG